MDIVEMIKKLAQTEDEVLITLFIMKAHRRICNYLNKEFTLEEVKTMFADALVTLASEDIRRDKNKKKYGSIKSASQGARSVTLETEDIFTQEIKDLLPTPYMKMR